MTVRDVKGLEGGLSVTVQDVKGLEGGLSVSLAIRFHLEQVRVPARNLIGEEGCAFQYILHNFNHERLVIAAGVEAACRLLYIDSTREALTRRTFGKLLSSHQVL